MSHRFPISAQSRIVLVRPHYPENLGAVARAMKVMGMSDLWLVKPSRIAFPEHAMAVKMAVKSSDVLLAARTVESLAEALEGCSEVFATTSRRDSLQLLTARRAAESARVAVALGSKVAFVFGNEKTGLDPEELALCPASVRIPMAADQPSVNLAQAVQIIAYELFLAGQDGP